MDRKWIYIVCMNDEYELPVFVSDSAQEICDYMGYASIASVSSYFRKSKYVKARKTRLKIERVPRY